MIVKFNTAEFKRQYLIRSIEVSLIACFWPNIMTNNKTYIEVW